MEFIVDGTHFTISSDDVRSKLNSHAPEVLHQYTVTIDGRTWPVKQAFSIATGLTNDRFQSQTARRQLQRLGFTINESPANVAEPNSPPRTVRKTNSFDPDSLVESDTVSASVQFTWYSVGVIVIDEAGRPVFPTLPKVPGLYRFTFVPSNAESKQRVYIGESTELKLRASQYRNAASENSRQRTSRRIHKEILEHLTWGGSIEFSIATEVLLGVDEEVVDLNRVFARRLAENAAVLLEQLNPNNNVMNIDPRFPPEDVAEADS